MIRLSLCMITKNEGQYLDKSLNSVKDLVDEIIIVDTGSTDNTKEIAKKFTNKIYDFNWSDDFSAARNESLKYATGEWIFVLDADEIIARRDHLLIKELLNDDADAFMVTQRTYVTNPKFIYFVSSEGDNYEESKDFLGWAPAKIVRLFRNNKGFHFSGRVHESVIPSISEQAGIIKEVNLPLHHFSILKGDSVARDKKSFYKKLGTLKMKENPEDFRARYEAARRCLIEKKFLEAKQLLEETEKLNPQFSPIYPLMIFVYAELNDVQKAVESFLKAKKQGSNMRSSVLNMAAAYEKNRMYEDAINVVSEHKYDLTDFTPLLYLLGKCFYYLKNYEKAKFFLQKVVEKDQKNINVQTFFIDTLLRLKIYKEAHPVLIQAINSNHPLSEKFRLILENLN